MSSHPLAVHLLVASTMSASLSAQASARRLCGTIIDHDRRLLSGVRVSVSGSESRAVSDSLGRFTLITHGPDTLTLRFLAIGYDAKEVRLPSAPDSTVFVTLEKIPLLQLPFDTIPLQSGVVLSLAFGRPTPNPGGVDTVGIALASEELFGCLMALHTIQVRDTSHTYLHVLGTGQEVCAATVGRAMWYSSVILREGKHQLSVALRDRLDRFSIERQPRGYCVRRLGPESATRLIAGPQGTDTALVRNSTDPATLVRGTQRLALCQ
jgi:hypothetical protein